MLDDRELTRLADMAAALRPDWHPRSTTAYLRRSQRHRGYADVGLALAFVALDPASDTPARLEQPGPWWQATRLHAAPPPPVGPGRGIPACRLPGHEHEPAHACRACRSERISSRKNENFFAEEDAQ